MNFESIKNEASEQPMPVKSPPAATLRADFIITAAPHRGISDIFFGIQADLQVFC